jgi:vacuolar-type H+-ATPase subunit E/Vma4
VRSDKEIYEKLIRRFINIISKDLENNEFVIETDEEGVEIVRRELEKIRIDLRRIHINVSKNISGGFIAYTSNREITYRYDINTLIDNIEEELKTVINKTLSGG